MRKSILVCFLLFLVQIGLVVLVNFRQTGPGTQPGKGPLLALSAEAVSDILLEDGDRRQVRLVKEGGAWLLPDLAFFPADSRRVQSLIDRVTGKQRGWPEATTAEAAGRFKVAADRFERRLTMSGNGTTLATVFFGASPGLRRLYVRVGDDPEIQAMAVEMHELEPVAQRWIDTAVLQVPAEKLTRVELPGLTLVRSNDALQPSDLAEGEEVVAEQRNALVKRLAGLSISGVVIGNDAAKTMLQQPLLRCRLEVEGTGGIDYAFARETPPAAGQGEQAGEERSYLLQVSSRDHLFRVDSWQVEEIRKVNRAQLVKRLEAMAPSDKTAAPVSGEVTEGQRSF